MHHRLSFTLALAVILFLVVPTVPALDQYNLTAQWGNKESNAPDQLNNIIDIAVDSAGYLYVLSNNPARIQKFSPDGKYLAGLELNGTAPGEIHEPRQFLIDQNDTMYILDQPDWTSSRIQAFSLNGTYLSGVRIPEFWQFFGIAENGDYYGGHNTGRLDKYTRDGIKCKENVPDTTAGNKDVYDFRTLGPGNKLYSVFQVAMKIAVYNPDGNVSMVFGSKNASEPDYMFPFHLTVDRSGNMYVMSANMALDTALNSNPPGYSNVLKIFDPSGTLRAEPIPTGDYFPEHVAVDKAGNIFIGEYFYFPPHSANAKWYYRIQKFSPVNTTPVTITTITPAPLPVSPAVPEPASSARQSDTLPLLLMAGGIILIIAAVISHIIIKYQRNRQKRS